MNHPDTKHMLELVEQSTGYRVSVDLISGIHEHAQMISARPESPVHLIRVNSSSDKEGTFWGSDQRMSSIPHWTATM